ncbi:MAG: hypothetical protein MI861_26050, partial [Pirellulales bacterium]|nr:hypothetical protein [Pirellulales bacterium]
MIRSLVGGVLAVWLLIAASIPVLAQQSDPADSASLPPGEVGEVTEATEMEADSSQPSQPQEYKLPPELQAEADKALAEFKRQRDQLELAMGR